MMKIFFIGSSGYILYLMKGPFRPTHDPNIDTFKIEYLLIVSFVAAMVFNYGYTFAEVPHQNLQPPFNDLFRFSGHLVFGLKASPFCLNFSSFKERGKHKTLLHIIYLHLV